MEDIQNNSIDIVIVYKIDRLSRSLVDFTKLVELFTSYKVSFVSVTQNFDTESSMGRLMLNVLLSFAQFEREMTGDRIRDKLRSQQKRGMWTGGTVPLGYDAIDKKLVINESESKIIKFIYSEFINSKLISIVTTLLKEHNFKTKTWVSKKSNTTRQDKSFSTKAIYDILTNKLYIGYIENKTINEIYKGNHEPIISEEDFNLVREIFNCNRNEKIYLKQEFENTIIGSNIKINKSCNDIQSNNKNYNINNANNNQYFNAQNNIKTNNQTELETKYKIIKYIPKTNSKVPYLLKGLMRCECCNSILTPTYTTKDNIVYRYYKANKELKHSNDIKCKLASIPAEKIENIILNEVYKILKSPEIVAKTIKEVKEVESGKLKEFESGKLKVESFKSITEQDIINSFSNIEVVWNELFPKEQLEIIHNIINEIIVSEYNLKIVFKINGFVNLLNEANINLNENLNNKNNNQNNQNNKNNQEKQATNQQYLEINIPVNFARKSGQTFIITPNSNLNNK